MDIKEHYISSLFFHVIVLLLAAAVSQPHLRDTSTLAISLSADTYGNDSKIRQAQFTETQESPSSPPISVEKTAVETVETPLEKKVAEEEKPEAVPEPVKAPDASRQVFSGISEKRQDAMWLAQIHHAYAADARAFVDNVTQSIQVGLLREIEHSRSTGLHEGTAYVTFYFNDEGGLGEIWGATNSEELESALNRLDWGSVPLPGAYRLKMKGLQVRIRINRGEPSFSFALL